MLSVVALTVTVADADLVWSATLVAFTVKVPAVLGAVYRPLDETLPPVPDQMAAVLFVPLTVAVNCCVPLVRSDADAGEIETETEAVTVTAADANTVSWAVLVAVTTKLPALLGAVYKPPEVMLPPLADHATPLLAWPPTVAVNC